jgi:ribosomal protein S18 acetylase RimI-like enzyme
MASSDPWVTLGVTHAHALAALSSPGREVFVAKAGDTVVGVAAVVMQGVLTGYLQTLAVAESSRGSGVGAAPLDFVERRVFREKPNVFLFVSTFNSRARKFYEAHGYELVGEVKDFLVRGYGECLMRKSIGPLHGFTPAAQKEAE